MNRYKWLAVGDANAFFGLTLDNVAGLILVVSLLSSTFGFPEEIALAYMIPGTALGVLFGDLAFTWMACRLARRTGRSDVTAMPLGLDTPSTFGMVFFVLGPAFLAAKEQFGGDERAAALHAWRIGVCAIVFSGLFKIAFSLASGWIRRMVPRAGLLGSLAAIALVLISFMPFVDIANAIIVGFVSLAIILTTLVARVPLPGRVPGALGALLVGTILYYVMLWAGVLGRESLPTPELMWFPSGWLEAFRFEWIRAVGDSIYYLPMVIPFALGTIIGGIDCVESAASAGDEYSTRQVIAIEGTATLLAGLCGGVVQTTPYIGHPAYKAMGGRAGYTLATALFIGSAGVLGYFSWIYLIIPKAIVFPILIFIGIEITAQTYHATPKRHYPAVALACVPALAYLVMIYAGQVLAATGSSIDQLAGAEASPAQVELARNLQTVHVLSGGFILTSLLWASALARLLDRRLIRAACYFAVAGLLSLFGVIHSPLQGSRMVLPWEEFPNIARGQTPLYVASAYAAMTLILLLWGWWGRDRWEKIEDDQAM